MQTFCAAVYRLERQIEANGNLWNFAARFRVRRHDTEVSMLRDFVFFDRAEVAKHPNGVVVIVLQELKVRGGKPEPVKMLSCREAGALALMEAISRALECK